MNDVPRPPQPRRRPAVARWVVPGAILAVTFAPWALRWDRLPSHVATHWDLHARPDGSMTKLGCMVLLGLLATAAAAVAHRASLRTDRPVHVAGPWVGLGALFGATIAGISVLTVASNDGAADWRHAGRLPLYLVLVVLLPAIAVGFVATRDLTRCCVPVTAHTAPATPRITVPDGTRVSTVQHVTNGWLAVPSAVMLVAGGALLFVGGVRWAGALCVAGALVSLPLASITVAVDPTGVRIAYGALRWPHQRIAATRVTAAEAIMIEPTRWGGWGYRGSLKILKKAAVVLRRGPGLQLTLRDGSVFAVSMPDPATAVAILGTGQGIPR